MAERPDESFTGFVTLLGQLAMVHMGAVPDPDGGAPLPKNLPMARVFVDGLTTLSDKTEGNLTPVEKESLERLIYALRMAFVDCCDGGESGSDEG